jgi:hypothetical protein
MALPATPHGPGPALESRGLRGRSSVGRALASQAKGRGFEARRPLASVCTISQRRVRVASKSTVRDRCCIRPPKPDSPQPGRRGQRRGRSRRSASVARCRRRFSSLASSRSSLSPTSRNIRSTTAPRPRVIRAMAITSPVNPPTRMALIEPATTSAAADPNARTRGRGATAPRYRFERATPATRSASCS